MGYWGALQPQFLPLLFPGSELSVKFCFVVSSYDNMPPHDKAVGPLIRRRKLPQSPFVSRLLQASQYSNKTLNNTAPATVASWEEEHSGKHTTLALLCSLQKTREEARDADLETPFCLLT